MKTCIRTIAFYDRFVCLGSACPQSCCRGWRIPVNEEEWKRYKKAKGLLGLRVRLSLSRTEPAGFSRLNFRCPLHDPDGLCSLQKAKGEDFMPEICRVYPREWANLGGFVERTLDLSCVHAAELFLAAADEPSAGLGFREETGRWEKPRAGDNDDPALLEELVTARNAIMVRLAAVTPATPERLDEFLFSLAEEARSTQSRYLRTNEVLTHRIRMFPFSVMLMNELMSTCFFEEHLSWSQPKLYRMCRRYYRVFDRLTEIEGQKKLDALIAAFFAEDREGRAVACSRYLAYALLRSYYDSYEDYSFVRRIAEAAIHLNMLLLFEAMARDAGETLDISARAAIIAAYEKRTWHNSDVMDDMVKQVNARLL